MIDDKGPATPALSEEQPSGNPSTLRRWSVVELMGAAREAIIEHSGQPYRLRITASGKLILTK